MRKSSEQKKSEYQREIFLEFLDQSGLAIEKTSIRDGDAVKGEPDILCNTNDGQEIAFELSRFTDGNLASVLNSWNPDNGTFIRTSDPSKAITLKKLGKSYKVSCPVELLLYKEHPIITPDDVIIPTIKPICESVPHSYSKVWHMGNSTIKLIYENN